MTREEIMMLGMDELEERRTAIASETEEADAETLDALTNELEAIEERTKALNLEIEESRKAAEAVAHGAGKEIATSISRLLPSMLRQATTKSAEHFTPKTLLVALFQFLHS